ncbi:hypothetical protein TWF481_009139 [Arthrobotrys musiformis]|uniref:Uncharacterized protein n=1 Tax=Arthrobotrys musiformis TaxID=47236 RepID=A0AAV9W5F7_9PEZI
MVFYYYTSPMPSSTLSSDLGGPSTSFPAGFGPTAESNDGTIEFTVIPISGTRPPQLGASLKNPTNMSIMGALSLSDAEYEQIRSCIDCALQNEALLRDLDVDAKKSTEQERKRFHNAVSQYLTAGLATNRPLTHKLTVKYAAISPWLLYKLVLLRRKKFKTTVKSIGSKTGSTITSSLGSNSKYASLVDLGNPTPPEESFSLDANTVPLTLAERFGLTEADLNRIFAEEFDSFGQGSYNLAKTTKKRDQKTAGLDATNDTPAKFGSFWVHAVGVGVVFLSLIVGYWFYKHRDA